MDEDSTVSHQHYQGTYNTSWSDRVEGNASWSDRDKVNAMLEDSDWVALYNVDLWLATVTILSLALLGVVGNIVCFVVWGVETSFNAAVFLFRYLAVWDVAFLVMVIVFTTFKNHGIDITGVWHVGNFVQLVTVWVTLLIAVSRWMAVVFPLHAAHLVTARRVYLSCFLVFLFCGLLEAAQVVFDSYADSSVSDSVLVTKRVVGLAFPLLLLLIFNINLLWTISRRSKDVQRIELRELPAQRQGDTSGKRASSSEASDTSAISMDDDTHQASPLSIESPVAGDTAEETQQRRPQKQQLQQQQQNQQQQHSGECRPVKKTRVKEVDGHGQGPTRRHPMEKAVLLISLCTFIAYPVGNTLQMYVQLEKANLSRLLAKVLVHSAFLCQVINSGVNVFIYWFFMPRFRQLAAGLGSRLSSHLPCGSGSRGSGPASPADPSAP